MANTVSLKMPVKANLNQTSPTSKPSAKTPVVQRRKACRETEIGGIWIKEPMNGGEEYMTGDVIVNGVKVSFVGFRNNYKDNEKKPDWRLHSRDLLDIPASLSSNASVRSVTRESPLGDGEVVEQNPAFLS